MLSISERLEKQRAVLQWLEYQTAQTAKTIRELEAQEREEQRRREVARRELGWKIQPSRAEEGQPMLHRGNCGQYQEQFGLLRRDEVVIAFQEFPAMEMCDICAPWGSLGIDKPAPRRLPGGGAA
ncbi:hypothetical protein J7E93_06525 [Streptomyces sp. ISL-36]|uniref:DUF6233 domain-containing protein n=1 Tax=Streptomyces sp. ISL-36 TaxID=2819182 RepID=UPI001BE89514|nr:DUF6233 domain-containing protein [Streptomyces sp. ISL-36]MBT2439781.1 hypothetical protein [Streptomyces sp. ISL-36]